VEWGESKNVRWKVEVPGRGSASPVVWGNRVFVTSAVPVGAASVASHEPRGGRTPREPHQFKVLAFDRATGKVAWERTAHEQTPHEASHQDNGTWASQSPITDGEHVIAYFESFGIYAYDMKGTLVWKKDQTPNVFSSPVGAAGRVYIAGREGTTLVLKHGPTFEVLASNVLDDGFDASPALVGGDLFMRGQRYLYCISMN
jgi:outer membrane protein assembly factor BamB